MERYDLIVIGSGPAGRRAAIQAAKLRRSVLVIENRLRVGGVSVHAGLSRRRRKTLHEAAELDGANAWHQVRRIALPLNSGYDERGHALLEALYECIPR